ncbi:FliM/FliN family flagellar motor switch protein [Alsobacter sp. SYSU M60028]|uniref:FliM/FliN family flagellar motor switch protein n=1 Tax=Alsobacter ponti TaxID=2962936 RepID=A0ABT1LEZ8_9HYPH|nr:FliM/FliN family flagellar motor switch protein [Alsobacter ponti]MCP8939531.1 FliM/FliN family flagellar motor switch protein [Alsobacter ponti]
MTAPVFPRLDLTADSVALHNALASHVADDVRLAGRPVRLLDLDEPAAGASCVQLRDGQGATILLAVDSFPFTSLLGLDLEQDDLPALPEPLRAAIEFGQAAWLVERFPGLAAAPWRIAARGDWRGLAADLRRPRLWMHVAEPDGATFRIGAAAADLVAMLDESSLQPRAVSRHIAEAMTEPVYWSIGGIDLPLHELRALAPGDVIVLPAESPALLLRLRGHRLPTAADGTLGEVLAPRKSHFFSTGTIDAMSETANHPLADLPVTLHCDIGQATLSVSDIGSLAPGSIVPLAPPDIAEHDAVVLRAGDFVVGHGTLVRIDDRLAVRIVRIGR